MMEPSRTKSRQALAGGIAAALLLAGGGFILGRGTAEQPKPVSTAAPSPAPTPAPVSTPPPPVVTPPLGRGDLIAAAASAADAFASGGAIPPDVAELAGRRFELSLPFGCAGPSAVVNTPLGWRYDEAAGALRVRVLPVLWEPAAWVPVEAVEQVEAIEGFWIPRPWTTSETCPAPGAVVAGATGAPDEQTLAVAQFYAAGGSRLGRRNGEALEAVQRVAPDALDVSQGLRLRLRGEVTAAPGDSPVVCRALAGADRRPVCLVSVSLGEVAIENPATGAVIATWDVSQRRAVGG